MLYLHYNIFKKDKGKNKMGLFGLITNLVNGRVPFANEAVEAFYQKYKKECDEYFGQIPKTADNERGFYVYAWRTKTHPCMYFYVGKGTGNRKNHVALELRKFREGTLSGRKAKRAEKYKIIEENFGIECEMVLDNLTESEALVYEYCLKLELSRKGEVLLDEEGVENFDMLYSDKNPSPHLTEDPFMTRYAKVAPPHFDKVTAEGLKKVHFYKSGVYHNAESSEKEDLVETYLKNNGSRIQGVKAKNASLIISGEGGMAYYTYKVKYGRLIYSIDDVVDFIGPKLYETRSDIQETDYASKRLETKNYIIDLLVEAGANREFIVESSYHGEIHLRIVSHGFVSFLCYKEKSGGRITLPLDDLEKAGLFDVPLSNKTGWKADFVFNDLDEIRVLMPFFKIQVEKVTFA